MKLSVVLATKNEDKNVGDCLKSVLDIASEIIVMDEFSNDMTVQIAKKYGAKVDLFKHKKNFHETKQKAIEKAHSEWILLLDADERVSEQLASEIKIIINEGSVQVTKRNMQLFNHHSQIVKRREPDLWDDNDSVVGYFLPRVNYFIGKPLIHAGVYPDGVIRLFRNGKGYLPAVHVHEQVKLKGGVGWLNGEIKHHDSPTLRRYLVRLDRYTSEHAQFIAARKAPKNIMYLFYYSFCKAGLVFISMYLRHSGYKDKLRGFLWSFLSSSHYPIAYFKYWTGQVK